MKNLSLHILDIVHNSIRGKASHIEIHITENLKENTYTISIIDDGRGIAPEILPTVTDPFSTTRNTRKVGMGLSLFKQNAEQSGGGFTVESKTGEGTKVTAIFGMNHFDRPPIGDVSGVVVQLVTAFPDIEFVYKHSTIKGEYNFDTAEIKQTLDGIPLNDPEIRKFLLEMINENLTEIGIEK